MQLKAIIPIALSPLFFLSMAVGADLWNNSNGAPIRQGIFVEWQRTVCPGENGSLIVIWSDTRFGSRNIFAQKITPDGTRSWDEGGVAVTRLPGRQEDPVAIEDGQGGAFISWVDYRFDEDGDIFYQHLNSNGEITLDSSGVALCQQSGLQKSISMCTDSLGGVFVSWQDGRNGVDEDIYGTHISASQVVVTPGTGTAIIAQNGDQFAKSIEYGGNHQVTVVWTDSRAGADLDIYLQKLQPDMTPVFASSGLAIATTSALESSPRTTFVQGDTSIIVWQAEESDSRVWYQLVNNAGPVGTAAQICTFASDQLDARVKRNSNGKIAVLWKDLRFDPVDGDIFIQQVNPDGSLQWNSEGLRVDSNPAKKGFPRLIENESDGVFVTWERGSFPEVDVLTNYITSSGTLALSDTGKVISGFDGYQFGPIPGLADDGTFYIAYANQGSGSIDLTIQSVDTTGNVQYDSSGILIRNGLDGDVKYVFGPSDGDSLVLTWEDNRRGRKIYGTRIESGGTAPELNGSALTVLPSVSEEVVTEPITIRGNDGIYIATFDAASGTKLIRLNKVSYALSSEWTDEGLLVNDTYADQRRPFLVPLPEGVLCFWSEIRNAIDFDIYYQQFDGNGTPVNQATGVPLIETYFIDEYVEWAALTPDGNILVFWKEDSWGTGVLKYTQITPAGQTVFGWPPGGYTLAGPFGDPGKLKGQVISLDAGVMLIWEETRNNSADIYGQILSWDGDPLLGTSGVPLTEALNDQTNPSFDVNVNMGTALVVWEDFRDGMDFNLYGQLVDVQTPALIDSNVVICNADQYQLRPFVKALDQFGYGIVWEDERGSIVEDPVLTGGMDVYMNGFTDHLLFDLEGVPVAREYHDQKQPQIFRLNSDEYLVTWLDLRSSGKADMVNLYGTVLQRTDLLTTTPPGLVPDQFRVHPAYPNPFNGPVTFVIDFPRLEPARLTIYSLSGAEVYRSLILPPNRGQVQVRWQGTNIQGQPLSSGIYLYRIQIGERFWNGKLTYLK
ncbi:MAG: T9SS type A sorting domain-containing protein [FCB group bacterium]|nr:T9SS type A sorting domain-containing protein [FCB group bacterium]